MNKKENGFFKGLRYFLLTCVIFLGFISIVATGGGGSGSTSSDTLISVVGPDPCYRVAVFYYPWYRNLVVDGEWEHWERSAEILFSPPPDISSDYYPILGAYSSVDYAVVAQHFAWLRQAGVGVIITSWWGQGSRTDQAVPVLLELAERYGMKVAFHIEPYSGRTAEGLVEDIHYIYNHYGDYAAFYRTTASSRWSPDDRPKGLFFVWASAFPDAETDPVEAGYWQEAIDAIHASSDGGVVISDAIEGYWIDEGHFDGLYNYATLDLDQSDGFSWARSLPPDAWYVPSVIPGFSARRCGGPEDPYVPRSDGATYDNQWEAALGAYMEPEMVAITSFNEWHEGTQIEPAAEGAANGRGYTYEDYSPLPPEGYLGRTQVWVERFLNWEWPITCPARIRMTTTSGWTSFCLVSGGVWLHSNLVSASEGATEASVGEYCITLVQPLEQAEGGASVEMVVDIHFALPDPKGILEFQIDRGSLGTTKVVLMNDQGVELRSFEWSGVDVNDPAKHPWCPNPCD